MKNPHDNLPFWMLWGALDDRPNAMTPTQSLLETHTAWIAFRLLLVVSILTGLIYPLAVTGIATILFPQAASGSLVLRGGQPVGSVLMAQRFSSPRYFWPRPSAEDDGTQHSILASEASNLGPTSSHLAALVCARAARFRMANGLSEKDPVPPDMLFASGSGLDPDISPASARLQIQRVARARKLDAATTERLRQLVERSIEPPQLGFLGEPRVNVFLLNLKLDEL
jgi:potassium-transporting ATPase KdpC subunit